MPSNGVDPAKPSFKPKYLRLVKGMIYLPSTTNIDRAKRAGATVSTGKGYKEGGKSKSGLLQLIAGQRFVIKKLAVIAVEWIVTEAWSFLLNRP